MLCTGLYRAEVTEEEKQAIKNVLDYNSLVEICLEVTADPVKTTYHAKNSKELMEYFAVWFRQFLSILFVTLRRSEIRIIIFPPNIDNMIIIKIAMWVKKLKQNQDNLILFILKYPDGCMINAGENYL